jgi:hypothetical protein
VTITASAPANPGPGTGVRAGVGEAHKRTPMAGLAHPVAVVPTAVFSGPGAGGSSRALVLCGLTRQGRSARLPGGRRRQQGWARPWASSIPEPEVPPPEAKETLGTGEVCGAREARRRDPPYQVDGTIGPVRAGAMAPSTCAGRWGLWGGWECRWRRGLAGVSGTGTGAGSGVRRGAVRSREMDTKRQGGDGGWDVSEAWRSGSGKGAGPEGRGGRRGGVDLRCGGLPGAGAGARPGVRTGVRGR